MTSGLFMHQVFQISRAGRADTAIYVPDDHYMFDYKGRYCLLIGGKFADGETFDQYAVGNYGIEGKAGTFRTPKMVNCPAMPSSTVALTASFAFVRQLSRQPIGRRRLLGRGRQQPDRCPRRPYRFQANNMEDRLNHARQHWQRLARRRHDGDTRLSTGAACSTAY